MLSVAPSVISLDPHLCWPSITSSQRDAGLVLVLVGMPGSSCSYSSSDPSSLLESDWPDSPESPESIDAKRLNAVCFFWTCGEQGIFRFGWPRCPEDASWPVHSRRRGNTARKGCRSWPLTSGPAWRLSYLTEVLPQVRRLLGAVPRQVVVVLTPGALTSDARWRLARRRAPPAPGVKAIPTPPCIFH
jgi:hypothetical protein